MRRNAIGIKRVILVMVGLLIGAGSARAQNLLANPGVEDVDGNRPRQWALSGGSEIIEDPSIAHSGRRCAKARFDDSVTQRIATEGGAAYRITGWIRRVEPGGLERPKIKVYFLEANGNRADVQAAEFEEVTAGGWQHWETVVQAPLTAKTLDLTLRGFFGGSEWFYYDDLSVERVETILWPTREATPNLHGLTVTVPDIADVWTEALLRIPPPSLVPVDGQLASSVYLRGQDIRVRFERPERVGWVLVHSTRPRMNLGEARFVSIGRNATGQGTRTLLAESRPREELVTSLRFESADVGEFVLDIPDDAKIRINEIQLLGLSHDGALPGRRVEMAIGRADPPAAVAEDLGLAFAAPEHRSTAVASPATLASGTLPLPADRYVNVFASPPADQHEQAGQQAQAGQQGQADTYGLAGLSVDLAFSGAENGGMIEVVLRRPEELDIDVRWTTLTDRGVSHHAKRRNYATVVRAISRVEKGRLSATFDVPDLVYPAGEPVWLTLRAREDTTLDLARSRVTLNLLTPEEAFLEYVPQVERLMRRMYSDASEAHAYDGRDWSKMGLGRYVARVLEIDPNNRPATWIYRRVAKVREEVRLERPGPAEAPDWAVWAREALRNRQEIITWWLDNRQHSNGELAGHINDDGEFSCHWPSHYLMTGDQRIADALRKLADVAWEMSGGTGYTVGSRDVEHAAEDQSCTQPQVLLVDYGNPKAVERLMLASRYLDFWTAVNSKGRRQFKSYLFNTKQIWDDPPHDVDHPYCPLAMVACGHLLWYTHSPEVAKVFLEEAESWAVACLSTENGKPAGAIPKEIRFRDSRVNPYAPYPTNPILQKRNSLYRGGAGAYIVEHFLRGAHALTREDRFGRVVELWTPPDNRKVADARAVLEQFTGSAEPAREGTWRPRQNETALYEAWRTTGDRSWLVEELKEVVRQQIRNRWLLTEAEPYTDRIPVPGRELLSRMFLGETTSGKSHVPGHWVSWEGGGLDYAALILDARPDHLKALVHGFHQHEQPMRMRVWRLPHGRYELSIGIDRDGDGQPDEQLCREEKTLWRYDGAVEFIARPGQTLVIELSLLKELDDVRTRPDLAIGPDDVRVEEGAIVLTVHNIGGSASPPSQIELRDPDSRVLQVARAPALAPPHDLEPITAQVRIPLPKNAKGVRIVLDPGNEVAEVTKANNEVRVGREAWSTSAL